MNMMLMIVLLASLISSSALAQQPEPPPPGGEPPSPGQGFEAAAGLDPNWVVAVHAGTGKARFLATKSGAPIPQPNRLALGTTPELAARAFLEVYGEMFGLQSQAGELVVERTRAAADLKEGHPRAFVRFRQVYQGLPVLGGELNVGLDSENNVLSINGEVLPDLKLDTAPSMDAQAAQEIALAKVAKDYGLLVDELISNPPELWIYNPVLLGGPGPRFNSLVWRMEVKPLELLPIRELVLVDARTGVVVLNFNQVDTARNRETYDANNTTTLPGTLRCNDANPTCSGGDTHEVAAHVYAGATYDFYMAEHGRDGIDNAGMIIKSSVHYDTDFNNAFWDGSQMVYGDAFGFPLADDVVAHELTHGVTQHESNLFYFYQSGAINESLSDVWGEFVDQVQATGNDVGDTRWVMGEDIEGLPPIRNMQDPTLLGDPDSMLSPNYFCGQSDLFSGSGDNGGVHTNSGVNNKAVFLMTDGGGLNGYTVTGLGYAKVADLYYEVQTNLLTSAADYNDLYNDLLLACNNLGYSASDCQEVKDALDATQMNQQAASCQATEAPICPAGTSVINRFFDNIESGSGNWTAGSITGTAFWFVPQTTSTFSGFDVPYATSGVGNIWGFDQGSPVGSSSDTYLAMNHDVTLPANASMHFNHSFGFESNTDGTSRSDGGVLEYSVNGGSSWVNAGSLFTFNGYNGTLAAGNPLGTIPAFSADSRGYISSKLDLSSLGGQNVRFRFRIGTDSTIFDFGWFIDDVRIYTCTLIGNKNTFIPFVFTPKLPPSAPTGLNATAVSNTEIDLTWTDTSNNETGFSIERSGDGASWSEIGTVGVNVSSYPNTGLQGNTQYFYRVRAYNSSGYSSYSNVDSDTTTSTPTICNWNFEQGHTCWTESSTHGWELIVISFPSGVTPHSGSWAAWLGGDYDDTSSIHQQVAIPAGSPNLVYWHWIASADVCGFDYGRVVVNGTVVDVVNLCGSANTGGWVQHVVNLNAYAGQSVSLQIEAHTDASFNSNLFVDDVSFQASPLLIESSPGVFDPSSALPR